MSEFLTCIEGADTLSTSITFSSPSETTLGTIPAVSSVIQVIADVSEAFDGSPTLTVGDDSDNDSLMLNKEVDLLKEFKYLSIPGFLIDPSSLTAKIFFSAGGATQGTCKIIVAFV